MDFVYGIIAVSFDGLATVYAMYSNLLRPTCTFYISVPESFSVLMKAFADYLHILYDQKVNLKKDSEALV